MFEQEFFAAYLPDNYLLDPLRLSRKEPINFQPGFFYLVNTGIIAVTKSDVSHIFGPGDMMGAECVLPSSEGSEEYSGYALASDTTVFEIPGQKIRDLLLEEPKAGVALIQYLVIYNMVLEKRLRQNLTLQESQRLAATLLYLFQLYGSIEKSGMSWMPGFSHKLLGKYIGTSREVVTHSMNIFRRNGWVVYNRKGIVISDKAALAVFAQPKSVSKQENGESAESVSKNAA